MNQAHGPLSFASGFLSICEGGSSPQVWRQEQTRRVEWTNTMRRSSGWLEEIVKVDLELSRQPLLGDTLAALMSRNAGSKTVATESASSRATFSEPARISERQSRATADRDGRKSFKALPDRVPHPKPVVFQPGVFTKNDRAESVLQLQPQAGASLLRRIAAEARELPNVQSEAAGGTNADGRQRKSGQLLNVAEPLPQDHPCTARLAAAQSTVTERFSPPTPMAPVEPATLLERAVRRIKSTLGRASFVTRALSSAVEPGGGRGFHFGSLTEHWSMQVSGPAASAHLLMRLASPDRSLDLLNDTVKDISSVDPPELSLTSSHVAPPVYDSTVSASQTTLSSTPTHAPAIAPPSVTPSLPPLHSHKQDDLVLPVAAATAQRQARIEEHIAREDDLPLLAERLDRILKQEARRHGIDV